MLVIGMMAACTPQPSRLEQALEFAGGNKEELLKVLRHYEGDTLKLRAAQFLIENMPHRYFYRQGGEMDSVKRVRTYSNSFGQISHSMTFVNICCLTASATNRWKNGANCMKPTSVTCLIRYIRAVMWWQPRRR